MRRIVTILVFCFVTYVIVAQPPQSFKYQAVVRNSSGELISNQTVGVRFSIHDFSAGGTILYQETHSGSTNEFGLANFEIGNGTSTLGTFTDIDWGSNTKFLEIEVDSQGGINYISMGTSELVSVPYALFSESSADGYWKKSNEDISYNNGNVGIGTSNPNYKLVVDGGSNIAIHAFSTNSYAILGSSSGTGVAGVLGEATSADTWGVYGYNGFGGVAVRGYSSGGWGGYFYGNMYVSGNTGIGTTTPDNKLVIKSSGAGDVLKILSNTDNTLAKFRHTGNNSGALYLYDGSNNNTVFFYGDGNSFINSGSLGLGTSSPSNAKLQIEGADTYDAILRMNNTGPFGSSFFMGSTNSAWGGGINSNIFVMGHGAPASNNIDLIINSSGQVGIATTAPTQTLDVNGRGRFRLLSTGAVVNAVYQTADGTLITGSSDVRLKDNIEPLKGSLEKINQLQGVSFTWKENPEQGRSVGFIAQDFEKIVPELVFTNQTDGYKGINYAEVSALLVEAIKEQQKTIEELRARIETLENSKSKNQ